MKLVSFDKSLQKRKPETILVMYRFFALDCHLLILCPDLHFITNKNCLKAPPVQLVLTHNSKIISIVLDDHITALRAFTLMWPAA